MEQTEIPREISFWECACHAPEDLIGEWDVLSDAAKQEFEDNGPIPCEGNGWTGPWCEGCRFGSVEKDR